VILAAATLLAVWASAAQQLVDTLGGISYRVVLDNDVRVYALANGEQKLVFMHPSPLETPSLDPALSQKRFVDLFNDGSRALAYRMVNPALNRSTLHVLRWKKGGFSRAGSFPEGKLRDLDGDGRFELVTQTAPLGRFLTVSCDRFETTVPSALKTDVMRSKGGKFESASGRYPEFFKARIAEHERALQALEADKAERAGQYISVALSLYFDHAAYGEGRRGWARLTELLDPKTRLPGAANCVEQITKDLRAKLSIPAGW
jgi:hypothetical protein